MNAETPPARSPGNHLSDSRRLLYRLRALWGPVLDFLLPAFCELCQSPLRPGERIVCDACWSSATSPANGGCPRCAAPFTPVEGACPACARTSYAFKGVLVVGPYDGTLGQLIRLMKYRPMPDLARRLGERLGQRVAGTPLVRSTNVVVPVPLHRAKSRERGFCQTTMMAREVARSLEVPLDSSVLRRTKWTRSQTKLSWPERRENVRGAFAQGGGHRPHNQKVLLVDDVFTSGATADEAAKVLLDLGAREVVVAAVARTPPVLGDGGAPPSGTNEGPAQSPAVGTRAGGPPDDGDRNTRVGDPGSIEHRVGPDANR